MFSASINALLLLHHSSGSKFFLCGGVFLHPSSNAELHLRYRLVAELQHRTASELYCQTIVELSFCSRAPTLDYN